MKKQKVFEKKSEIKMYDKEVERSAASINKVQ